MPDRAILLLRQSETRDQSVSLDSQETECRRYCETRGYAVVEVLREESIRGWQEERVAIDAILARVARREVDVLIVWHSSRLARKLRIAENILHEFERHHARVESVTEPWFGTPFVRQVLAAVAEEQSRTIAANVSAALRERARRGISNGRPPFGYRRGEDGRFVVVESEAAQVRRVYDLAAGGASLGMIHRALNTDPSALAPRGGARWTAVNVAAMLHNPIYRGAVVHGPRGRHHATPVVTEDAHPAIIPAEAWWAAQRVLAGRAVRHRVEKRRSHWLEGRVRCGACGEPMYWIVSDRPGTTIPDDCWYCRSANMRRNGYRVVGCPAAKPRIAPRWVDGPVKAAIVADLKRVLTIRPRDVPAPASALAALARQQRALAEVRAQRERLIDAVQRGTLTGADVERRLRALDVEAARLEATVPVEGRDERIARELRARAPRLLTDLLDAGPEAWRTVAATYGVVVLADTATHTVQVRYEGETARALGLPGVERATPV